MHIISMIVVGLIVGALAKLFMPGRDPGGLIVTVALGIAGSVLAGWIGHTLGWYSTSGGPGIFASIIGSMLLLGLYRLVVGRRRRLSL